MHAFAKLFSPELCIKLEFPSALCVHKIYSLWSTARQACLPITAGKSHMPNPTDNVGTLITS